MCGACFSRVSTTIYYFRPEVVLPGIFVCLFATSHENYFLELLENFLPPLPSARQHLSYGDCLEVKREYYQNCFVLGCVTQCSQSAAHSCEQFLQVQQIGFVTF